MNHLLDRILENLAATKTLWTIVGTLVGLAIFIFAITGIHDAVPRADSQEAVSAAGYICDKYTTRGTRIIPGHWTRQYHIVLMVVNGDDIDTYTVEVSESTYDSYWGTTGGIPCAVTYNDRGRITSLKVLDDDFDQISETEGVARDFILFAISLAITGAVYILFGHRKKAY